MLNCSKCDSIINGCEINCQTCGSNFHTECMSVDASNLIPCSYPICDNCSQQLFPFTQLDNDDFAQTLTSQEIITNDFSKFTSLKLHPVTCLSTTTGTQRPVGV